MKWAVYFLALLRSCDKETVSEICKRFEIAPRHRSIFCKERFEADRFISWMERHLPAKNSTIYRGIFVFKIELILYMMAATKNEALKRSISNYFTQLRHIETSIKGKDLKELGLKPGPIYREILEAVLDGKLNGRIKTRREELAFVKDYAQ
jgi:tRNA nucleotidyltransferase (CCA-adding enzyme)